jgi:hypothetical protein
MKHYRNRMFNSPEEFERLYPYASVLFSQYYPGAVIDEYFSSKKNAERKAHGEIMTRRQATIRIKEWNEKHGFDKQG